PIYPVRSPGLAASILGPDLPQVLEILETADQMQVLRRLQRDRFTAGVASVLFRNAAIVLGRFYADTTAQPGATYEYRVTFLDEVGQETATSISASVTVEDRLPAAPTAAGGSAGNAEARFAWRYDSPHDRAHDFVLGFTIERAVDEGEFEPLGEIPQLRTGRELQNFVDHTVENGRRYRYRVRAIDLAGRRSEPSAAVTVEPFDDRAPSTPRSLVTEPGEGRVRLAWRISPEPNVVGYHVERSTGLDQPFTRLTEALVPLMSPIWLDQSVRGGTQYFYRIVAVNDQGAESRPSNPIAAVPTDETPPEPPAEIDITVVDRQLRISWTASPSDDVRGYHIYRGEESGAGGRLTEAPHEGTEFVDRGFEGAGLRPGVAYTISVTAVDHSFNESVAATTVVEIPDDEPPAAPSALELRNVEGRLVEISWSSAGSLDLDHYRVTRETIAGPGGGVDGAIEIGGVPADGRLRVRDEAVETGAEYRYRVVAVDRAGNVGEAAEASIRVKRLAAPPSSRRVVARAVESGVSIRWERVVDDELVGYRVYRATIPTGVYTPVSELIAPGGTLEFIDHGGSPTHYYQVRAVDRSGNESRPSEPVSAGGS
ncbi:MAG TPA: fibronectin type III domain-containing protein, partial [Brevibacterium sp.]|nr:fibronectin type III domain-containing protein [Brevibacterium sp.]